ncbi:HIT-like domain-containing protein [Podospora australis]|uniref:HIT-like domain-containing protein n=1 Tax=Podospora australis TaxID=1536484 RepID=A0AAN6WP25_9PEZI|nr:HIT-like domain-containing protein [Podospora australis]
MTTPCEEMPPKKIPVHLPELVKTAFNRACASGDVNFYPTQVALLTVNSLPFQLRFSPSLANKPRNPLPPPPISAPPAAPAAPAQKKFFNPFESPLKSMLVATTPTHTVVLNKFAIVPEHFILATTEFKPQTHLLEAEDLEAAWGCIEAYHAKEKEGEEGELYVFFNSGPHSGASQPHRHLQLLPVSRMRDGLEAERIEWNVLANSLAEEETRRRLPFQTFTRRIPPPAPFSRGAQLRGIYLELYREACCAGGVEAKEQTEGEAKISYNLALTKRAMVLVPRVAEGGPVFEGAGEEGKKTVGKVALNGTVLAGTALVKTQEEWDALRKDPGQLGRVLGGIGVPWVEGEGKAQGFGREGGSLL